MVTGRAGGVLANARIGNHRSSERGRCLGWVSVCFALALSCAQVVLVPAAHAVPPDQTWIGGIYDVADYDDVVLLVGLFESLAEDGLVTAGLPISPIALLTAGIRD